MPDLLIFWVSFSLYTNPLFIRSLYFSDKLFILDSLGIIKIKEFVLEGGLAAEVPYIMSNIIYNRKNFVYIEYN